MINNAFSKYNLTIQVSPKQIPSFEFINDIGLTNRDIIQININISSHSEVSVIEWNSKSLINGVHLSQNNSLLNINGSELLSDKIWAKLKSDDSWGNTYYSNGFNITKTFDHLIAVSNTFGPLQIFTNKQELFLIPKDLFFVESSKNMKYAWNIVNCSVIIDLVATLQCSIDKNNEYLYLFSTTPGNWQLTISIQDLNNNISEILADVIVKNWASKDWIECTSELRQDCK